MQVSDGRTPTLPVLAVRRHLCRRGCAVGRVCRADDTPCSLGHPLAQREFPAGACAVAQRALALHGSAHRPAPHSAAQHPAGADAGGRAATPPPEDTRGHAPRPLRVPGGAHPPGGGARLLIYTFAGRLCCFLRRDLCLLRLLIRPFTRCHNPCGYKVLRLL